MCCLITCVNTPQKMNNEKSTTGFFGTDLGKCTCQSDEKERNNNTQALSTIRPLQVKEGWQTSKEETSKEEDGQEGAGAGNVENVYVHSKT